MKKNTVTTTTNTSSNKRKAFAIGFAAGAAIGGCSVFAACKIAEKRKQINSLLQAEAPTDEVFNDEDFPYSDEIVSDSESKEGGDQNDSEFSNRTDFVDSGENSSEAYHAYADFGSEVWKKKVLESEEDEMVDTSDDDVAEGVADREAYIADAIDAISNTLEEARAMGDDSGKFAHARRLYIELRRSLTAAEVDDPEISDIIEKYNIATLEYFSRPRRTCYPETDEDNEMYGSYPAKGQKSKKRG